jgi:hypothetical protein
VIFLLRKILTILTFYFCLVSTSEASIKLDQVEQDILADFVERCDRQTSKPSQFPDAYLDESSHASCEIAGAFRGAYYKLKAANNTAAMVADGTGVTGVQDLESIRTRSKHFGFSIDDEIALRTFSVKNDDPLYLKHAQSGDPFAIWTTLFSSTFNPAQSGKGVPDNELAGIAEHLGQPLADFLFLSQEDLKNRYPDYQSITTAATQLIDKADQTSRGYLQVATHNLIRAATLRNDHEKFWFVEALLFPHELRLNLLKLDTLTGVLGDGLRESIRIIEYGLEDKIGFFHIGTDSFFAETENRYVENKLLDCSISLFDALKGLPTTYEASFYAQCLRSIEDKNPGTLRYLSQIFAGAPLVAFKDFDIQSYKNWRPDLNGGSSGGMLSSIFAADLRYLLTSSAIPQEVDFTAQLNFLRKNPDAAFSMAVAEVPAISKLHLLKNSSKLKTFYKTDLSKLLQRVAEAENRGCGDLSDSQCAKMWRALDLDDYFENKINVKLASLQSQTNACDVSGALVRKLLKHRYWAGGFSSRVSQNCPRKFIQEVFGRRESINSFFSHLTAFPSASTGINLLRNSDYYLETNFGQLASHLLASTPNQNATILPYSYFNVIGMSDTTMSALHRTLMKTSPLRSIREKTTGKNEYWRGSVPHSSLADSFALRGADELAFVAKQRQILDIFKDPDIYDRSVAQLTLQDAMIFARQAGIPLNFVSLFGQQYTQEIKDRLKSKDQAALKLELSTQNLEGNDAVSLVLNSYNLFGQNKIKADYRGMFKEYELNKNFTEFFLKAIAVPEEQIQAICDSEDTYKTVKYFDTSPTIQKQLSTKLIISLNVYFQYARFTSTCRLSSARAIMRDNGKAVNLYDDFLKFQLLPFLKTGGVPSHPSFFPLLVELAWAANKAERPFGAVVALALLKNNLSKLTEAYVQRNSGALRTQQAAIETVLAQIIVQAGALKERSDDEVVLSLAEDIFSSASRLAVNFSIPILSNKTRARFVFGTSKPTPEQLDTPYGSAFQKASLHFKESSKLTAKSKTPADFVINSAERALHGQWLNFNAFNIFNRAEEFLKTTGTESMSDSDFVLNFVSSDDQIVVQILSKQTGFHTITSALPPKKLSLLKTSILKKKDIDKYDVDSACAQFAKIHSFFDKLWANTRGDINVIITPSVNLMPIPSELIIGSACDKNKRIAIFHTGDALASVELLKEKDQILMPDIFVGVGNPIAESTGFQISLSEELKRGGLSPKETFDLSQFPPLPDAAIEVQELASLFTKSTVLQDMEASITAAFEEASSETKKKSKTAMVLATHGVAVDYENGVTLPGLLSSTNGKLSLITNLELEEYDLTASVVALSACDTATGFTNRTDQYFTGFVTSFANAGSEVVLASLWPVVSSASKDLTASFFAGWKKSNIMDGVRHSKNAIASNFNHLPFVYIFP